MIKQLVRIALLVTLSFLPCIGHAQFRAADDLVTASTPFFGLQNTADDPTFVKSGTGTMAFDTAHVASGAVSSLRVTTAADNTATSAAAAYAAPQQFSLGPFGSGQTYTAVEALVYVADGSNTFYTSNLNSLQLVYSTSTTTGGISSTNSVIWNSVSSGAQPIRNNGWNLIRLWLQDGIGTNGGDALMNGSNMGTGWKSADTVDGSGLHTFYAPGFSSFKFSVQGKNSVAVTAYLARMRALKPMAVFVIQSDNWFSTVPSAMLPIVNGAGLLMGINVNATLVGAAGGGTWAQLDAAYAAGNDITNHAYDYSLNPNTALTGDTRTSGTVLYQIARGGAAIAGRYPRSASASFTWNLGYGGYFGSSGSKDGSGVAFSQTLLGSSTAVTAPYARAMTVSSTTMIDNAGFGWPKDPWYIRRNTLAHAGNGGSMDPVTWVNTIMPNIIASGKLGWFNVHKVENPIVDPTLAITTPEMQAIVDFLAACVANGTCQVLTPSQYVAMAGAR